MNVKYALRALKEIEQCNLWWIAHRDLKSLFEEELAATIKQIRNDPGLGRVYRIVGPLVQRRILMPKTVHHLYYRLDGSELILVLSVWGA